PRTAAGPAWAAWPGRAQHPRDVRRHRGEAEQVPAPDRAPRAPRGQPRGTRRQRHGAAHRRPRLAPRARPGRPDDHPAGDAGPQPGGAHRSRHPRARAARQGRGPGRGFPRPTHALPGTEHFMSATGNALIIVSGMSGSGKTVALNTFEDLDFYCVDNLPAELLPDFVRSATHPDRASQKLAVGIDVRSRGDLANMPEWLSAVGAMGFDPKLVFFDTTDDVLLKRYADTRRRHPLTRLGLALSDAIALERQVLRPLSSLADVIIDTSELNVHQLRRTVLTELGLSMDSSLSLLFESFA